jgi:NAD(P)H-dependent FMN reductase
MIEALNQFGDKKMALAFQHCGNAKLEAAGNSWRPVHRQPGSQRYGSQAEMAAVQWGHPL